MMRKTLTVCFNPPAVTSNKVHQMNPNQTVSFYYLIRTQRDLRFIPYLLIKYPGVGDRLKCGMKVQSTVTTVGTMYMDRVLLLNTMNWNEFH